MKIIEGIQLKNTIKQIRKRVGPDYPIMYRIDLSLALNCTYGEKMHTIKALKKFRKAVVEYIATAYKENSPEFIYYVEYILAL